MFVLQNRLWQNKLVLWDAGNVLERYSVYSLAFRSPLETKLMCKVAVFTQKLNLLENATNMYHGKSSQYVFNVYRNVNKIYSPIYLIGIPSTINIRRKQKKKISRYKYKNISTCSIQNYSQGLMSAVGQLFDADCDKLTKQNSSDL